MGFEDSLSRVRYVQMRARHNKIADSAGRLVPHVCAGRRQAEYFDQKLRKYWNNHTEFQQIIAQHVQHTNAVAP